MDDPAQGIEVRDEDAARLSPLKAKKVNVLGRYAIVASQPIQGLRPLLDPTNPGDQDVLDCAPDGTALVGCITGLLRRL